MNFLEKLDFEMDSIGINKSKLSQLSGVPYTTIDGFYKKGYENAKISTIRKIAKTLGVSLDYLIEDVPINEIKKAPAEVSPQGPGEEKLLHCYRSMNADGKSRLLEQAELLSEKYRKDGQSIIAAG